MKEKIRMYSIKNSKGQAAIEYMVLAAAVVLVLITFLAPGGIFHQRLNATITESVNQLEVMANDFNVIP